MDCEERTALLAVYHRQALSFLRAVNNLREARDEKWQKGFMMYWDAAHEALAACISAQDRLECHISTHRCEEQVVEKAIA